MATVTILPATTAMSGPRASSLRVVRPVDDPPTRRVTRPLRRATMRRPVACERSYPPDLRGSRLTGRGRRVVALAWLVLAMLAAVPIIGSGSEPVQRLETTTVVIEPGDTLWALARSFGGTADPRAVIDTIVDLNGLRSGADIQPGDVLVVPVAG